MHKKLHLCLADTSKTNVLSMVSPFFFFFVSVVRERPQMCLKEVEFRSFFDLLLAYGHCRPG